MKIIFLYACFLGACWHTVVHAQVDTPLLMYEEYIAQVLQQHPIARQATLHIRHARAERLHAKGAFDPLILGDWDEKNFKDDHYYRIFSGQIIIPTALGIDIEGGYENTSGTYLNPEQKTDDNGLWHAGLSVNLLQGLLVNERNTALRLADRYQSLAENEQQIMLNDLIYDATYAYIIWQEYSAYQNILLENIRIAADYLQSTKISFENGEKTAMDTLEAYILWQDAITQRQKNTVSLTKYRIAIDNYLWQEGVPLQTLPGTSPQPIAARAVQKLPEVESAMLESHPLLLTSVNKIKLLEIEQRLKREKRKPKLKVKYNALLATEDDNLAPTYAPSDFKWGFQFSMPILFRSETAAIQQGEIKIEQNQWELNSKRNELSNKIETSRGQFAITSAQVRLLRQSINGYRQLLTGEKTLFDLGESSVFMVNKRQEKYIQSQLKLVEVMTNQQLQYLDYRYFSNQLL